MDTFYYYDNIMLKFFSLENLSVFCLVKYIIIFYFRSTGMQHDGYSLVPCPATILCCPVVAAAGQTCPVAAAAGRTCPVPTGKWRTGTEGSAN